MRMNILFSMIVAAGGLSAAGVSSIALAQNATGREVPRPQDVDPAVNTSAPPVRETPRSQDANPAVDTSARPAGRDAPRTQEMPRPQDIEPGVDTSAPAADGASRGAAAGAAAPGAAPVSKSATASGAKTSRAPGAPAQAAPPAGAKGKAQDRLELDTTQITGNRELPKVLYIVPWKRSDLGDLVGKPVNSLLDEVLTPVDRDVFQRENRYYRALTPGAAENDALSADEGRPAPARRPSPTNGAPAAGSPGSATRPPSAPGAGASTASGSAASPPRDEK